MPAEENVLNVLKNVQDPDLHKDIVTLGFVKNLKICDGNVRFDLELTTPACPVKDLMKEECIRQIKTLPGVKEVNVRLTSRVRSTSTFSFETLKNVKNIIAVGSGKGGVGKSTAAINLALGLKESGASVGLMDADVYGPSMGMMLGSSSLPAQTQDGALVPSEAHGLRFISVGILSPPDKPLILRGPMIAGIIQQFLGQVEWGSLDYLVIDLPPGTGDIQLTLCQKIRLTGAVMVTTPQDVALLDARKCLRMFQDLNVPVMGIIENMSYFICDNCNKKHTIFSSGRDGESASKKTSRELGVPFLGGIPLESHIPPGGDTGVPLLIGHPESLSAEAFRKVAGLLASQISIIHSLHGEALFDYHFKWDEMDVQKAAVAGKKKCGCEKKGLKK